MDGWRRALSSIMTRQELIREIIARYHNARQPLYPHERVFRGESRAIASETEGVLSILCK